MNSINNTTDNNVFNAAWDAIEHLVPFDNNWGGTYPNQATKFELAPGEVVKTRSGELNNRKMIMIGTMFGTIVLFERYTNGQHGTIVSVVPHEISCLQLADLPSGRLGSEQVQNILGAVYHTKDGTMTFYKTTNISYKLDRMREIFSGEYTRKIQERLRDAEAA